MELRVALWELALREDASWCVLQVVDSNVGKVVFIHGVPH